MPSKQAGITKGILVEVLEEKFKPLASFIDEIRQSVQFLSEKFDSVVVKVGELTTKAQTVTEENGYLKSEGVRLSGLVEQHSKSLNDIEQYSRRQRIEIAGVPESEEEDTNEIVVKVGEIIGVQVSHDDISASHRLPKPRFSTAARHGPVSAVGKHPKIIVKFVRRATKERFYQARKHLKSSSTRYLGLSTTKYSSLRASPQKIRNYLMNV